MATRTLLAVVIAAGIAAAGCDVSQQKPEVTGFGAGAGSRSAGGALHAPAAPQDSRSPESAATSDQSIRLLGRGIDRKRQTRV